MSLGDMRCVPVTAMKNSSVPVLVCLLFAARNGWGKELPKGRPSAFRIAYDVRMVSPEKKDLGSVTFIGSRDAVLFSAATKEGRFSALLDGRCQLTIEEHKGKAFVEMFSVPRVAVVPYFPLLPGDLSGLSSLRPMAQETKAKYGCIYQSRDLYSVSDEELWQPAEVTLTVAKGLSQIQSVSSYFITGKVLHKWTYGDYRLFDGFWVPGYIKQEWLKSSGFNIPADKTLTWTLTRLEKVEKDISPESLLPEHTRVGDRRIGSSGGAFIYEPGAGTLLEQAERAVKATPEGDAADRPHGKVLVAIVALIGIGFGLKSVLRRRKRA